MSEQAGPASPTNRLALGICYRGQAYLGWQSQPSGQTVQDLVEAALSSFAGVPVRTVCAGRTDAGVHALNQVVHVEVCVHRESVSWVRGTNRYLPSDIAVEWCVPVPETFHARFSARGRRYIYILRESPHRPSLEAGGVGWSFRPLAQDRMQDAADRLLGERDFSAFRSSQCQAASPVKELRSIRISRRGSYWRFEFDASAFLHHMVRNIMGCLVAVGTGARDSAWLEEVLDSRRREHAAPTFSAAGLYFVGPYYDDDLRIPSRTAAMDWLP